MTATTSTPLAAMEEQVAAALAKIEAKLSALGDAGDVALTAHAQEAWHGRRSFLWALRRVLQTEPPELRRVWPKIEADEVYLADLKRWRQTIAGELLEIRSPIRDAATKALSENLTLSIRVIDHGPSVLWKHGRMIRTLRVGELMRASGYRELPPEAHTNQACGELEWYGSIGQVEERLKDLRRRRDDAQQQLDKALMKVEALA
jgi:hypothetical protein